MQHREPVAPPARLTRQQWLLVALGLGVWVALGFGGVWFVHQMTRSKENCGTPLEARSSAPPKAGGTGPRNALQLLTGTGRCK
jgi:hypothetical protein